MSEIQTSSDFRHSLYYVLLTWKVPNNLVVVLPVAISASRVLPIMGSLVVTTRCVPTSPKVYTLASPEIWQTRMVRTNWKDLARQFEYSRRPKSGRPDFGILETCPVPKSSGYRTSGPFTVTMSRFRMPESQSTERSKSGHNRPDLKSDGKYVWLKVIFWVIILDAQITFESIVSV